MGIEARLCGWSSASPSQGGAAFAGDVAGHGPCRGASCSRCTVSASATTWGGTIPVDLRVFGIQRTGYWQYPQQQGLPEAEAACCAGEGHRTTVVTHAFRRGPCERGRESEREA